MKHETRPAGQYTARKAAVTEANARTLRSDPLERPEQAVIAPQLVSAALWQAYSNDPIVNRTINQVVEHAVGDSTIRPNLANDAITEALDAWWTRERMGLRISPAFKQWLISGEQWHYVPLRRDTRIRLRELVPWRVAEIEGHHWTDWEQARYNAPGGEEITLTPDNTTFFAHDAIFGNLRGLTPFATLAFSTRRYARFLDARERVNRLAGTVTGELNFENIQDAAAVLGWPTDEQGNPKPQTVYLPEEGTIAVTVGNSRFQLAVPSVNSGGAEFDAQRFYLRTVEGGRLPEYTSGNGANVNVATAQVQYPFAVRFILALRDEFESAMNATVSLVLARMVALGFIPNQWTATRQDGSTEIETPDSCRIAWSFPEVRELDFRAHFDSVITLVDKNLLHEERAMQLLGYDPDTDMPTPEERERRRATNQPPFVSPEPDDEQEARWLAAIEQAARSALHGMLSTRDAPTD